MRVLHNRSIVLAVYSAALCTAQEQPQSSPAPPSPAVPELYERTIPVDADGKPLDDHLPPLVVQAISTLSVCAFLALIFGLVRLYYKKKQQDALGSLPLASPDGSWLLITYDWCARGGVPMQSGRMPLDGINNISELVCAVVEYGTEAVDSEISSHNVEVKYTDGQGVERRLGAKTRFNDVRRARLLRVTRRSQDHRERASLMWGTKANLKRTRALPPAILEAADEANDDDDITVIDAGPAQQMVPVQS